MLPSEDVGLCGNQLHSLVSLFRDPQISRIFIKFSLIQKGLADKRAKAA